MKQNFDSGVDEFSGGMLIICQESEVAQCITHYVLKYF